jgi:ATP-dependent DNA helicase RecG
MQSINIKSIVAEQESQHLEFKTTFDREAIETIVAFSNAGGGVLLIGVNDNSQLINMMKMGRK